MNPDRAVQEVVPTVTGKGMFAVLHAVCGGFYPVGVSGAVRLFLRLKFVVLQYLKNFLTHGNRQPFPWSRCTS